MRLLVPILTLTALCATVITGAAQTTGDRVQGRAFALQACTPCHVVAPNQISPKRFADAPAFRDIAKTRGVTETSLHAFLSTPHPSMPNLILSQTEQDDVIAYILSLGAKR